MMLLHGGPLCTQGYLIPSDSKQLVWKYIFGIQPTNPELIFPLH